jgi:hypothetical protein
MPILGAVIWQGLVDEGPLGAIAVLVGATTGFAFGPRSATGDRPRRTAVIAASLAALGTALTMSFALAQPSAGNEPAGPLIDLQVLVWMAWGTPVGFVIGLTFALPVAWLSVGILRLGRRRPVICGLLVTAAVTGAIAATIARPAFFDIAHFPPTDPFHPVRIEWIVANHGPDELEVGVMTGDETESSGTLQGIPGCFVTTGTEMVGDAWFIAVAPFTGDGWPADSPPVVSAADVPGTDVVVWIEVAIDGTATFRPERGRAPAEALVIDLCAAGWE